MCSILAMVPAPTAFGSLLEVTTCIFSTPSSATSPAPENGESARPLWGTRLRSPGDRLARTSFCSLARSTTSSNEKNASQPSGRLSESSVLGDGSWQLRSPATLPSSTGYCVASGSTQLLPRSLSRTCALGNIGMRPETRPTAFFHRPEEFAGEIAEAGFVHTETFPVEGPGWLARDLPGLLGTPVRRKRLLSLVRSVEAEPSLHALTAHLVATGAKPSDAPSRRM